MRSSPLFLPEFKMLAQSLTAGAPATEPETSSCFSKFKSCLCSEKVSYIAHYTFLTGVFVSSVFIPDPLLSGAVMYSSLWAFSVKTLKISCPALPSRKWIQLSWGCAFSAITGMTIGKCFDKPPFGLSQEGAAGLSILIAFIGYPIAFAATYSSNEWKTCCYRGQQRSYVQLEPTE